MNNVATQVLLETGAQVSLLSHKLVNGAQFLNITLFIYYLR